MSGVSPARVDGRRRMPVGELVLSCGPMHDGIEPVRVLSGRDDVDT